MSKISASGGILVFEIDAFMRIIMSMGQPVIKNVVTFSSISIARRPDRQPCNCCYPSVTRRKSVICERRLSVCLLEWAKGFEPSTQPWRLCPSGFWALLEARSQRRGRPSLFKATYSPKSPQNTRNDQRV